MMARIVAQIGPVKMVRRPDRFAALVRAIIFQQLAGRAAQTIHDRFVNLVGAGSFPSPEQVIAASDEIMRQAGLSRGKLSYIRDLAGHVHNGTLNFRRFPHMDDEAIIAELTRVRGIGRWTAEMFLMFNLWRPDVLPVDDLGLRNAAAKAYGISVGAKELRAMGEPWRPYRTAASWYLWQSTRIVTPDGAPAAAPINAERPAKKVRKRRAMAE